MPFSKQCLKTHDFHHLNVQKVCWAHLGAQARNLKGRKIQSTIEKIIAEIS